MKHAVVIAHPNPDSLTCAIGHAYCEAVRGLGHDAFQRDLYRIRFDPCLKASEVPTSGGVRFGDDVLAERALIARADVFAFIYPFWFNAPPAILKGYVDRVFSMGFGYEPAFGGTRPKLEGKALISFTTSGAPEDWVRQTGAMRSLATIFDSHVAGVCGLKVIDHVHTGGIVPGMTVEAVEAVLAKTRKAAQAAFASTLDAIT